MSAVLVLQMTSDKSIICEKFDTMRRILNLIFKGYQAEDWKINTESLDIFLTTFMQFDMVTYYKRKLIFEDKIIRDEVQA